MDPFLLLPSQGKRVRQTRISNIGMVTGAVERKNELKMYIFSSGESVTHS